MDVWLSARNVDSLGIFGVGLVTLYEGFNVLRGQQLDFVTERQQLPCPMVRTGAGFHGDKRAFAAGKECEQLGARDAAVDRFAIGADEVELEYVLGKINGDGGQRGGGRVHGSISSWRSKHVVRLMLPQGATVARIAAVAGVGGVHAIYGRPCGARFIPTGVGNTPGLRGLEQFQ